MRKLFTNGFRLYAGFLTLFALIALGAAKAEAATDLGVIEFGKTYDLPNFAEVTGTLVIPADAPVNNDGKVVVKRINGSDLDVYTDAGHQTKINSHDEKFTGDGTVAFYDLEKGKTYYVHTGFNMSSNNVSYYVVGLTPEPLKIESINHSDGSTWDLTATGDLRISFNQEAVIPATGHKLTYTDRVSNEEKTADVSYADGQFLVFGKIKEINEAGNTTGDYAILPGDDFKVTIAGVRTDDGRAPKDADADGNLNLTYRLGSEPMVKVSGKFPDKFLSYWAPGDPDAVVSLTFRSDAKIFPKMPYKLGLSEQTGFTIGYGNLEEDGKYYYETVPVKVSEDGLTVTADLSDKLRTTPKMFPSYPDFTPDSKIVALNLRQVTDQYGNPVKADTPESIGSFQWGAEYVELERANITSEFTPSNGTTLDGAENMEVYLSPIDKFSFTGFLFTYPEGSATKTVVVKKENCTVKDATATDATYEFAIPAEVKGKKNVTVTLDGFVCADGYDHSTDVRAVYDGFTITYSDPANNAELALLKKGDTITIETNYSEKYPEMYIMYQIEDMNPKNPDQAIIKSESWLNRQTDGSYKAEIYGEYKLISGHEYRVEFMAWENEMAKNYKEAPVGEAYITLLGTTAPYVPSDIQFVSIEPSDDTVLAADQRVFTITFDGMVNLDSETTFLVEGSGMTSPFESIVPVEPEDYDGKQYASVWNLTVSESYMKKLTAALLMTVVATDMEGRRVQGGLGDEDQAYFQFEYDVASQFEEYTLSIDGEEPYSSVKEFKASAGTRGINFSYAVAVSEAYVADNKRAIVARVAEVTEQDVKDDQRREYCTLVLDKEITAPGSYTLVVPQNYFNIGEQYDSRNSAEMTYSFTIPDGTGALEVAFSPEEGDVVSLPEKIEMVFTGYTEIGLGSGNPLFKVNGADTALGSDPVELDDFDYNKCTVTLPQEYTEPGTYTLSFPAGCFNLGDNGDPSPAFSATWTIKAAESLNVTTDPAQGNVTSLSEIELTFVDYSSAGGGTGKATLTIDGGEPVNLEDAGYGEGMNQMIQPLDKTYTEKGKYVISFPAGYFNLGDNGDPSPAFKLEYEITVGAGVSGIEAAEDGRYHVYTVSGVAVLDTDSAEAVKALAPGIYIVNNVKVYIK